MTQKTMMMVVLLLLMMVARIMTMGVMMMSIRMAKRPCWDNWCPLMGQRQTIEQVRDSRVYMWG